ncbi:MAG: hypothetical protein PWP62_1557 [Eubacteriaceae bacterium]|nr:hypothetical protein [Eubacteriaceae bacterium]
MLIEKIIDLKNGVELKGYVRAKSYFDGEFDEEEFSFIGYAFGNKPAIIGNVNYCTSCDCTKEECEEAKRKFTCNIPYKTYYILPDGLNLYIDGVKIIDY